MNTKVQVTRLNSTEALALLEKAYKADPSASYVGDFLVNGSTIQAEVSPLQNTTGLSSMQRFDFVISSSVFSELSLRQIIE